MLAVLVTTVLTVAGIASALLFGVNLVISSLYNPEDEAAKEVSRKAAQNRQRALFELGRDQQREEATQRMEAEGVQALTRGSIAETTFTRRGMRDSPDLPDADYLRTVSNKMGMDPEELTRRLDPRQLGPPTVGRIS